MSLRLRLEADAAMAEMSGTDKACPDAAKVSVNFPTWKIDSVPLLSAFDSDVECPRLLKKERFFRGAFDASVD